MFQFRPFGKRAILALTALLCYVVVVFEIYAVTLVPLIVAFCIVFYDRAGEHRTREYLRVTQSILFKREEEITNLQKQIEHIRYNATMAQHEMEIAKAMVELLREELWMSLELFYKVGVASQEVAEYITNPKKKSGVETSHLFTLHYMAMQEFRRSRLQNVSTMEDL